LFFWFHKKLKIIILYVKWKKVIDDNIFFTKSVAICKNLTVCQNAEIGNRAVIGGNTSIDPNEIITTTNVSMGHNLNALKEQIIYWIHPDNITTKTIEIIQLFYDL